MRRHCGDHCRVAVGVGARKLADRFGNQAANPAAPLGILRVIQAAVFINALILGARRRRQLFTVKRFKVFARNRCDIIIIMRCNLSVIGNRHFFRFDLQLCLEANITARSADQNVKLAALHTPIVRVNIIESKGSLVERNAHFLLLTRLEEDLDKGFEFLLGTEDGRLFIGNINLRHFGAGYFADIFNLEAERHFLRILDGSRRELHGSVLKLCIRKSVTEGEHNVLPCLVIVAIADVNRLSVLTCLRHRGIVTVGRVITICFNVSLCRLARGVDLTGEDVRNGNAARLTAQAGIENGFNLIVPRHLNHGAACKHHCHIGIDLANLGNESVLTSRHIQVLSVIAFALKRLCQACKNEHHIRRGGNIERLTEQCIVEHILFLAVTLGIGDIDTETDKIVECVVELCRVDNGGTGALIARLLCHFADNGDLLTCFKRQDTVVIFEQLHGTLRHSGG